MKERYAGVLLPITALPSPYGVGTLGAAAKSFVEFLVKAKQKIWQVLPLVPTGYGDSPYASSCAIAGSPYLIDIDNLIEQGLLTKEEAEEYSCASADGAIGRVNYEALFYRRIPLLKLAFSRFDRQTPAFKAFLAEGEYADFAAFMAQGSKVTSTVRCIKDAFVTSEDGLITFTVSADGFLYNMVRIMAGTLLAVAEQKISPEEILEILASRNRALAGSTLPACGLYLNRVVYPGQTV